MAKIRVIDWETTGFEPPAEICEVGICDVDTGTKKVGEYRSWLCGISGPMPPETRAVHHISAADCEGFPPFDPDTVDDDSVWGYAAHNAEFERKFFTPHKPMICTYKAALRVWPDAPSHSNGALRYWLEDQGLIKPAHGMTQPAHRAGPDAYVTGWLLVALLNAGATGKDLVQWSSDPKLLPKCTIGKFRGVAWADVDLGFLQWMMKQVDMDADLKWNAARELKRRMG